MSSQQLAVAIIVFTQFGLVGCDAVERARSRFGTTTTDTVVTSTGSGLALGLQAPPTLRPGDEGLLRLSLNNQTDTTVSQVRLELHVPDWIEPMAPRAGERPVTMSALENGTTVFAYGTDDTPLQPGQISAVDQRIRVPAAGSTPRGNAPWTREIRARLLGADGRVLAEVTSAIGVDTTGTTAATATAGDGVPVRRERIGPVQLGMNTAAVKQAASGTRDTTWTEGRARRRGVLVPVGNGTALASLSGDVVTRLEVGNAAVQTEERLGVGSRMSELQAAYGVACAGVIDGRVVVWFARAPGAAFVLNTPAPRNAAQLDVSRIPGTAQVTRWWLSRDVEPCATGG